MQSFIHLVISEHQSRDELPATVLVSSTFFLMFIVDINSVGGNR